MAILVTVLRCLRNSISRAVCISLGRYEWTDETYQCHHHVNAVPRATAMTTAAAAAAETQWEALPSKSEERHTCKPMA